jgi:hypothetical protein
MKLEPAQLIERESKPRWSALIISIFVTAATGFIADANGMPVSAAGAVAFAVGATGYLFLALPHKAQIGKKILRKISIRHFFYVEILALTGAVSATAALYWLSPRIQKKFFDRRLDSVLSAKASSDSQAARIIEMASESKVKLNPSLVYAAAERAVNSGNYKNWEPISSILAPHIQQAIDEKLEVAVQDPTQEASLSFADVDMKTASLIKLGAQLPPDKVDKTSILLERAVSLHPDSDPGWQAAGRMISYRSYLRGNSPELPSCITTQGGGGWHFSSPVVNYHDCTLNLNDITSFDAVTPRLWQPGNVEYDHAYRIIPTVVLTNGIVTYSGGEMIRMQRLIFVNCRFDLNYPEAVPPPAGRALTQQLLVADLNQVSISLPSIQREGLLEPTLGGTEQKPPIR